MSGDLPPRGVTAPPRGMKEKQRRKDSNTPGHTTYKFVSDCLSAQIIADDPHKTQVGLVT